MHLEYRPPPNFSFEGSPGHALPTRLSTIRRCSVEVFCTKEASQRVNWLGGCRVPSPKASHSTYTRTSHLNSRSAYARVPARFESWAPSSVLRPLRLACISSHIAAAARPARQSTHGSRVPGGDYLRFVSQHHAARLCSKTAGRVSSHTAHPAPPIHLIILPSRTGLIPSRISLRFRGGRSGNQTSKPSCALLCTWPCRWHHSEPCTIAQLSPVDGFLILDDHLQPTLIAAAISSTFGRTK